MFLGSKNQSPTPTNDIQNATQQTNLPTTQHKVLPLKSVSNFLKKKLNVNQNRITAKETDILISARFLGDAHEAEARELCRELQKLGMRAFIVDAGPGDDFARDTIDALDAMKTMVAFCTDEYGAKTSSKYSSFYELTYAVDQNKHILPVKRCKDWPPKPKRGDYNGDGARNNKFHFKSSLLYRDWSNRKWDARECAKDIKEQYEKKHGLTS